MIDYDVIEEFFLIDELIKRSNNRIKGLEYELYNRSFTPNVHTDTGEIRYMSVSIENIVTNHVDVISNIEQRIEENRLKKRYLADYINQLDQQEKMYIVNRYVNGWNMKPKREYDYRLYEEIQEIQTAINFRYGRASENSLKDKQSIINEMLGGVKIQV